MSEKILIEYIDHIAIKITNLPMVSRIFEELGLSSTGIVQHDEVGMRIAFLGNHKTRMELLEVTAETSPIVNDKPGLHHLGIKVRNIETIYEKMKENHRYKVLEDIRQGAHSRVFFFKISGQEEILFECVE